MRGYRVFVVDFKRNEYSLLYAGEDENEAIEVYEESRSDVLFGMRRQDVCFTDDDGNQLARTDHAWFGKINPY